MRSPPSRHGPEVSSRPCARPLALAFAVLLAVSPSALSGCGDQLGDDFLPDAVDVVRDGTDAEGVDVPDVRPDAEAEAAARSLAVSGIVCPCRSMCRRDRMDFREKSRNR